MAAEIVALQSAEEVPQSTAVASGTNLLLPATRAASRFDHFPEEVYDLSAESHLARFLKVLLGDAGAGQTRKRLLISRLQQTLQGTHFYDLDRFYGALFGVRRSVAEILDLDPYTQTATTEVWTRQHAKDASYRSRVTQFARALGHGATPTGMELVAEALLAVDCEVYEAYVQADSSYQTHGEIEAQYATYADMEGVSYGTLEGVGLGRLAGDARREFVVRPKRMITQGEAYDLTKVLNRLKPADARFVIDTTGVEAYDEVPVRGLLADSNFWEVIPQVVPRPGLVVSPYQVESVHPVEQPRPPFTSYQGEAWSYVGDVIGVSAYVGDEVMPPQRVVQADGSYLDYPAHQALLPRRHILAGRSVSDGVLVSHPYWSQSSATSPDLAPLYTDRVPLDRLSDLLASSPLLEALPQNPAERFWSTPHRLKTDPTPERLEIRLAAERLVNHISLDVPRFPHDLMVEAWLPSSASWEVVARQSVLTSVPQYLPPQRRVPGHPQHSHPGHWQALDLKIAPVTTSRLRITQVRNGGEAPVEVVGREVAYSLGVRSLDPGYRVYGLADIPSDVRGGEVIGSTVDPVGSTVDFVLHQENAADLLQDGLCWKSEPQPVAYAVVNLYLDVRDAATDAQIIERFYLDPSHSGAHLTIYWTAQVGEPSDTWYEQATWTPIPRDYSLQKGFIHIPPTRARHFKFEFTSLTPEPFESFLPLVRKVRLFPRALVRTLATGISDEAMPPGLTSAMSLASTDLRYGDALDSLSEVASQSQAYDATEALYAISPVVGAEASARSWAYGFQPWHQGDAAPRFLTTQVHQYETVELKHITRVGFFVGLYDIKAFSVNPGADDDTPVYVDNFHDFRQITPGFTWTFNPNALTTELAVTAVATSKVYSSRHNVRAVQFATQQSDPEQLVPDDDFRDPALGSTDWHDDESWHKVGDGILVYSSVDHSVVLVRYSEPLLRPQTIETKGLALPVVHPTFATRSVAYVDSSSTAGQTGGIESPLLGASATGRAYAAVRLTFLTNVSADAPMRLQVVDGATRAVLSEQTFFGTAGETTERVLPHNLTGSDPIRVRLVQQGVSDDQVKIDTLSLFDEGILWEFSVNGGSTWVPAIGVRNNANGIVTFPEPGNQLVWRATGMRQRMAINAIKIRPQYVGAHNARDLGVQRGPNVSTYDADVPIQDDPMFTDWTKPVPRYWFSAYKRFPKLPVEGAPNITEFSRFYGRPVGESITPATDAVSVKKIAARTAQDWPGGLPISTSHQQPISRGLVTRPVRLVGSWIDNALYATPPEVATRTGVFRRSMVEQVSVTDESTWFLIYADPAGLVNRLIHPI